MCSRSLRQYTSYIQGADISEIMQRSSYTGIIRGRHKSPFAMLCSCTEASNLSQSTAAALQLQVGGKTASVTLSNNIPPHLHLLIIITPLKICAPSRIKCIIYKSGKEFFHLYMPRVSSLLYSTQVSTGHILQQHMGGEAQKNPLLEHCPNDKSPRTQYKFILSIPF